LGMWKGARIGDGWDRAPGCAAAIHGGLWSLAEQTGVPLARERNGVQRAMLSGRGCGLRSGPRHHSDRLHSPLFASASA
jgi:hypothetical protein